MANAFKLAARLGPDCTFASTQGDLLTHQLWTLPLKHPTRANLNSVANAISVEIKSYTDTETDFVGDDTENNDAAMALQILEMKLEIVKAVIKDVKKENADKEQADADAAQDRVLDELIAKKKLEKLGEEDIEALVAMKSENRNKKKKK